MNTLTKLVCSFVVIFMLAALSPARAAGPNDFKVSIQLNWLPEPEFGGIYEAQRAGIFAKHGLEVRILKGGPDVPAVQMAAAGTVDFGLAAADEVIGIREHGGNIVGIYATYQTAPQGIMAHEATTATDIPSLLKSGATLAVQPGLAYVKYFQKQYDMSRVKLVPYQGGVAAFLNDPNMAQQCFVTSEPLVAKKQGVGVKVFLIADTGFNPYTGVVITREANVREHRVVVQRMVAALREGWAAYMRNPEPANEMMSKLNPSMDLQSFAEAAEAQKPLLESDETKRRGLGAMTRERWETLGKQLVELGVVEKAPLPGGCYVDVR